MSIFRASFIFLFVFNVLHVSAQSYYPVEVLLKSGEVKSLTAKLPKGNSSSLKCQDASGDSFNLLGEDIDHVIFTTEEGNAYVMQYARIKWVYMTKAGKLKEKEYKKPAWLLAVKADAKMMMYTGAETYKMKNGEIRMTTKGQAGFVAFPYYFQRPGEEHVSFITDDDAGLQANANNVFRNTAIAYFQDTPELVKRLQDKEFKKKDVFRLYDAYLEYE